jgi:hypothetical protein
MHRHVPGKKQEKCAAREALHTGRKKYMKTFL